MDLINNIVSPSDEKNNNNKKDIRFKDQFTFEQMKNEATRIRSKYPDRVPIIVERANGADVPLIDKKKYLVPGDLSVAQFIFVIRRRIKLRQDQALFLFIEDKDGKYILAPANLLVSQVYKEYTDTSGFLFFCYSSESTFGSNK